MDLLAFDPLPPKRQICLRFFRQLEWCGFPKGTRYLKMDHEYRFCHVIYGNGESSNFDPKTTKSVIIWFSSDLVSGLLQMVSPIWFLYIMYLCFLKMYEHVYIQSTNIEMLHNGGFSGRNQAVCKNHQNLGLKTVKNYQNRSKTLEKY